jgi:Domain of unknown function (DUF6457)
VDDPFDWLDRLADALGERRIEPKELGAILKLSRQVAHGVERRLAPASAYLAGLYVGRETVEGTPPEDALAEVLAAAGAQLPEAAPDGE